MNVVNNPATFTPLPSLEFEDIKVDGKSVIRVWVPMSPAVHRYKGQVYDRVMDSDVKLIGESQITMLYMRKQNIYSEQHIYPYLEKSDLRLDLLPKIRQMAVVKRSDHPWKDMDDETLLQSAKLYGRNYETGQEGLNLAAALLLGNDNVIGSICPAYKTDAILRKVNLDRYDDREIVRTNLIESYEILREFCDKHLSDPFYLEDGQVKSLRGIIVRELVSNLLVHREFTSPFPAKLIIDNEGIHTENASRALFEGKLTLSNFNPMPKNPIIASFFNQIGYAEELGSGTKNLFKYSKLYMGADPVITEGDIFRTFIPDHLARGSSTSSVAEKKRKDVKSAIYGLLDARGRTTVAEVAETVGVTTRTASNHLRKMVQDGQLVSVGTTSDKVYRRR